MRLAHITSKYRASLIVKTYAGWLKKRSKVADIGCGTGVVGKYLSDELNLDLTGTDIDNYLAEGINFKKMNAASRLPFQKGEFEYSMFNDVLHHTRYQNQSKLLKESLRVSKEVLIFELRPTLLGKFLDFALNKVHNLRMDVPFTYRAEDEWIKLFKELKLKYKIRDVNSPFWYPFSHVAFKITK